MKLEYKQIYPITQALLKGQFEQFEKEKEPYKIPTEEIIDMLYKIIYDETHGMTSYLTPRISTEVLEYLEKNYHIDFNNKYEILFKAINCTNNEVIQWLLNKIDNINIQDKNGNTPLHLASKIRYTVACSFNAIEHVPKPWELPNSDNPDKVKIILLFNPNVHVKNNDGKTPIQLARDYSNYRVEKLLNDFMRKNV